MEHLDLKSLLPDKRTLIVNACDRSFIFKGLYPKETLFWDYNYDHPFHKERFETYIDGLSLLESQGKYALKFFLEG